MNYLSFQNLILDIFLAGRTIVADHWKSFRSIHRDGYSRLYLIKDGQGQIRVDGQVIILKPGDLVLIPRGHPFQLGEAEGMDHIWIHFDCKTKDGLPLFDLITPPLSPRRADDRDELYITQISEFWNRPDHGNYLNCLPLLNLLLVPYIRDSRSTVPVEDRLGEGHWLFNVLTYLNAHLEEDIPIAGLAKELGCHPTYLSNAFSKKFGLSPRSYVVKRRIEQSQQLLWHSDIPVKEVASQCGFGDIYYFYRCFKKLTGLTPGEYRKGREPYQYEKLMFR